jgi:hypothetical protein
VNVSLAREYGGYQAGWLSEAVWYDHRGKRVTQNELKKAWDAFERVSDALSDKASELNLVGSDMSVNTYLTQHLPPPLRKMLKDLSDTSYHVFYRLVSTVWGYVGPVERLSARLMAHAFKPEEEDQLLVDEETGVTASPEAHVIEEALKTELGKCKEGVLLLFF